MGRKITKPATKKAPVIKPTPEIHGPVLVSCPDCCCDFDRETHTDEQVCPECGVEFRYEEGKQDSHPINEVSEKTGTETPRTTPTSKPSATTNASATVDNGKEVGKPARPFSPAPTTPAAAPVGGAAPCACATPAGGHNRIGLGGLVRRQQAPKQVVEISETVAGYTPTAEQREGLEKTVEMFAKEGGQRVLVLVAGAGAGKTSELKMIEQVLQGRGQYTAFNKSLVEDSRSKFTRASVNTTHSLAFKDVGREYSHRLGGNRIRSEQVAAILGIQGMDVTSMGLDGKIAHRHLKPGFLAGQVLVAIRNFCQSADPEVTARHFRKIEGLDVSYVDGDGKTVEFRGNDDVREYLLPFVVEAWADLVEKDGKLPFHHDVYVKLWQLGVGGKPYIPAEYILLDEYQDTAPVFVDILKQQTHALLVLVGDDNQRIYEWRGAINAGDEFPDAPRSMLSQSFRFGQAIADVANTILSRLEEPTKLRMKGNPSIPSRVAPVVQPRCILCRTNAAALSCVLQGVEAGQRPYLIGGSKETVAFVRAAQDLQRGKTPDHPELGCFSKWVEVQEYAKTDEGEDLALMVKLVDKFTPARIIKALENMPTEEDADFVASTAHKSKGREWPSVQLAGDFPLADRMSDSDRRLLYVAATRAQEVLDVSKCPTFAGGKDREGNFVPGLRIAYGQPMPDSDALEAYRTSKGTKTVEKTAEMPSKAPQVAQEASEPENRPVVQGFTWANYQGKWCVRGPHGSESGKVVTVVRGNGSKSQERLGKVVNKFGDKSIYEVMK